VSSREEGAEEPFLPPLDLPAVAWDAVTERPVNIKCDGSAECPDELSHASPGKL